MDITVIVEALENLLEELRSQEYTKTIHRKELTSCDINDIIATATYLSEETGVPIDKAYVDYDCDSFVSEMYVVIPIKVVLDGDEKEEAVKEKFNANAYSRAAKKLKELGYVRHGFPSNLLAEFDDTSIYDMFVNKEFDRLAKYFGLGWSKKKGE